MVEFHYKFFKSQPSLLYKREPEIIFDCPQRISPAKTEIPVYLFVKDSQNYDFFAEKVRIQTVCKGKNVSEHEFGELEKYKVYEDKRCDLHGYRFIISKPGLVLPPKLLGEKLFVYPKLTYKILSKNKKPKIAAIDNINTSSKLPFCVFLAEEDYPNDPQNPAKFYDMHCHSSHTNDHIEFGAPVEFIADCAHFCGLDGVAITDHSYDISCKPHNFLEKDENLTHWQDLQEECVRQFPIDVILGEEISVMRGRGGAVHLCALAHKNFVAGTADGARKGYKRAEEPTMSEAINSVLADGGQVFAAHPGEIPNFSHRLFLRRDFWRFKDFFQSSPIAAFQGLNGNFDKTWKKARNLWIKLLLSGKNIPLLAGNDSHGDFNRYRATNLPFLCIHENFERHFAKARTGFYGGLTPPAATYSIMPAIKEGRTFITTGPFIDIQGGDGESVISNAGEWCEKPLTLVVKSSREFGRIKHIRLYFGDLKAKKENFALVNPSGEKYSYSQEISPDLLEKCDYLRAETATETKDGLRHFAVTSCASKVV